MSLAASVMVGYVSLWLTAEVTATGRRRPLHGLEQTSKRRPGTPRWSPWVQALLPGVRSLRHPSRQRRRLCGPPPAVPLSTQRGTLGAAEGSGLVGGRGPPTPPTEPCAGRRPPRAAVAPRGAAGAADRALRAPRSGGRPRQGGGPDRGAVLDQQGVRVEAATGRCSSAAAVRRPGLGPRASLGPSKGRVGPARGAFRVEGPVLDHQGGRAGRPLRPWSPLEPGRPRPVSAHRRFRGRFFGVAHVMPLPPSQ